MRGNAERIRLVRRRAASLTRSLERRAIGGLSAACAVLFAALFAALGAATGPDGAAVAGLSGAMLLYEDAGGYVLVGVVSFVVAVFITVLCMRSQNKPRQGDRNKEEPKE